MRHALKLGFVGGGINSAVGLAHKIAVLLDGRFELVAGCFSRDREVNIASANEFGVDDQHLYHDWNLLLKNEKGRLDAIVVLTPTPFHTDIVIKAIEQGFPVICEKSLTATVEDALRIKSVLDKYRGFLTVTYNYTGYPMLRELKKLIADNYFGELHQVHVEMPQEGFIRLDNDKNCIVPQEWRLHDSKIPTISLDLGAHVHNIIDFLTGEQPLELVATTNNHGLFSGITDDVMCLANYTNGLVCNIWFSKVALGHRNGLKVQVYGNKASAGWSQMNPEFIELCDNQGRCTELDRASVEVVEAQKTRYNRFKAGHPAGFIEAFANYYFDVADSLHLFIHKKGKDSKLVISSEYVFSIDSAISGLEMLEKISESTRDKKWKIID